MEAVSAGVMELAVMRDSKSRAVTPRAGSTPASGTTTSSKDGLTWSSYSLAQLGDTVPKRCHYAAGRNTDYYSQFNATVSIPCFFLSDG